MAEIKGGETQKHSAEGERTEINQQTIIGYLNSKQSRLGGNALRVPQEIQERRNLLTQAISLAKKGDYSGVPPQLDEDEKEWENELAALRGRLKPFSQKTNEETMPGDKEFIRLQNFISRERGELLAIGNDSQAAAVHNANIERHKQAQLFTERGIVLSEMNGVKKNKDYLALMRDFAVTH